MSASRVPGTKRELLGVPVDVYYPPVAERVSHFKPGRDTLRIIGTVVRVLVLPG